MNAIRTCVAVFLLVGSAGGTARAVEPPKPHNARKLIVINDDGFSAFFSGRYRSAQDLKEQVLALRDTQVGVLEWCVISGSRANYPSKTTELIGHGMTEFPRRGDQLATETLRRLADEGVDTLQVVAAASHEAGLCCYASMRMNGDYSAGWMGPGVSQMFNSGFWHAHPQFHVRDRNGNDGTKLSYAYPEVRAFRLNILREVAERDIDGVNLDFLRHPPFLEYDDPLLQSFQQKYGQDPRTLDTSDARWVQLRCDVMTGFLRDVRTMLDEAGQRRGRRIGLSARVEWNAYKARGCDVEAWLKAGLLDYLVVAQHSLGGYEFDIAPFVAMAKESGCAVLFGEEATVSGHDLTPEEDKQIAAGKMKPPENGTLSLQQYRQRAARWYAAGADGVQLFNEARREVLCGVGDVPPAASDSTTTKVEEDRPAAAKVTHLSNPLAIRIMNYGKYQDAAWTHLPSIGMHHIFLPVPVADEVAGVEKRLADSGLKPLVLRGDTDLGRETSVDELAAQLAVCEKMGVKYMFLSPKHTGVSKEVAYERLRQVGDIAKKHGVIVGLETHRDLGTNGDVHLETMKAVNHPNIRVNFDTGNITFYNRGTDAVSELKKIIDYVAMVELKDHNGQYETWNFPALGKGVVDFPAILKILEEHGYAGPITMEVEGVQGVEMSEPETLKYIADSIAYIQSLGNFK